MITLFLRIGQVTHTALISDVERALMLSKAITDLGIEGVETAIYPSGPVKSIKRLIAANNRKLNADKSKIVSIKGNKHASQRTA